MIDISWNNTLKLHIKDIDFEHEQLFSFFDQLKQFMPEKETNYEMLKEIIIAMGNYAVVHFRREEDYLKETDYPFFEEHKKQHQFFIDKVEQFRVDFLQKDDQLDMAIGYFLCTWFLNHILAMDKGYVPYLVDKQDK